MKARSFPARRWLLILVLLLTLPLSRLIARGGDSEVVPYGWQMFSVGPPHAVVLCDGEERRVTRAEWIAGACDAS